MIIIENNKVAAEKLINKSTKLKDLEKTEYFQKFYELDPTSKRYPDNPKFLITLMTTEQLGNLNPLSVWLAIAI